jgi:hypothetical protein
MAIVDYSIEDERLRIFLMGMVVAGTLLFNEKQNFKLKIK